MRTRLGLKLLGLSALVMGVIVVGTVGVAQAETGACWGYKSGATLPCFSASLEAKPVIAIESSTATLLIGSLNIEVLCTTAALIDGATLSANGSILLGRLLFGGCISLSKTPTLAILNNCRPTDPVDGVGTIRSEKLTGLIVLHNGQPVVELKPDETDLFTIFLGTKCGVAEELLITGSLVLADTAVGGANPKTSKEQFEKHMVTHLIEEFPALKLMKAGGATVTIEGTATVTLEAPHNAFEWAGHSA